MKLLREAFYKENDYVQMPSGYYEGIERDFKERYSEQPRDIAFEDKELILLCAFRYALGRQTYIVSIIVDEVVSNWSYLNEHAKELIHREINECFYLTDIDKAEWNKVLKLEI